jgi:hypothetical protein
VLLNHKCGPTKLTTYFKYIIEPRLISPFLDVGSFKGMARVQDYGVCHQVQGYWTPELIRRLRGCGKHRLWTSSGGGGVCQLQGIEKMNNLVDISFLLQTRRGFLNSLHRLDDPKFSQAECLKRRRGKLWKDMMEADK